eukprot:scaffold1430_cov257-Pinguiococcus_pyrenoidosus.AAC.9
MRGSKPSFILRLGTGLLLLLFVERQQRNPRDLDHLEAHSRDISYGVSRAPEPRHQHLVVLIHIVEAAVIGHEARDLLGVLDQLHPHAFPDSGVGLLGLNAHLLYHDALGHGAASQGVGLRTQIHRYPGNEEEKHAELSGTDLHRSDTVCLHIALGSPLLLAPQVAQLASGADATRLSLTHGALRKAAKRVSVAFALQPLNGNWERAERDPVGDIGIFKE